MKNVFSLTLSIILVISNIANIDAQINAIDIDQNVIRIDFPNAQSGDVINFAFNGACPTACIELDPVLTPGVTVDNNLQNITVDNGYMGTNPLTFSYSASCFYDMCTPVLNFTDPYFNTTNLILPSLNISTLSPNQVDIIEYSESNIYYTYQLNDPSGNSQNHAIKFNLNLINQNPECVDYNSTWRYTILSLSAYGDIISNYQGDFCGQITSNNYTAFNLNQQFQGVEGVRQISQLPVCN